MLKRMSLAVALSAAVVMPAIASTPYDKPGFVTKIEDGRLWVFKQGSKELEQFEQHGEPTVIHNQEGGRTTPSMVSWTVDGDVVVGAASKRQMITNPTRTVAGVKRHCLTVSMAVRSSSSEPLERLSRTSVTRPSTPTRTSSSTSP